MGKVEKTKNGLRFTEVLVQADVILGNPGQSDTVDKLAELAEKYCLVSNSVAFPVHYEVEIKVRLWKELLLPDLDRQD